MRLGLKRANCIASGLSRKKIAQVEGCKLLHCGWKANYSTEIVEDWSQSSNTSKISNDSNAFNDFNTSNDPKDFKASNSSESNGESYHIMINNVDNRDDSQEFHPLTRNTPVYNVMYETCHHMLLNDTQSTNESHFKITPKLNTTANTTAKSLSMDKEAFISSSEPTKGKLQSITLGMCCTHQYSDNDFNHSESSSFSMDVLKPSSDLDRGFKLSLQSLSFEERMKLLKIAFVHSRVKHPSSLDKEALALALNVRLSTINRAFRRWRNELYDSRLVDSKKSPDKTVNSLSIDQSISIAEKLSNPPSDGLEHENRIISRRRHILHQGTRMSSLSKSLQDEISKIYTDKKGKLSKSEWRYIRDIASRYNCTKKQLYRLMQRLKTSHQKITEEKKTIIKEWMKDNQSLPTKLQMQYLIQISQLSEEQIRYIIQRLKDPTQQLTEAKKKRILEWLKVHDFNTATNHEIITLLNEIGLSRQQLRDFCGYIRKKKVPITDELKKVCKELFESKSYNLSPHDIEKLHQDTGLHKKQIYWLLRKFSDKYKTIDERNRFIIKNWLHENNYRTPTSDEYTLLQETTELSRKQLTDLTRYYKHPRGKITQEKREKIETVLQSEANLSPLQVQEIAKSLELSIFQVRTIARNILKKKASEK